MNNRRAPGPGGSAIRSGGSSTPGCADAHDATAARACARRAGKSSASQSNGAGSGDLVRTRGHQPDRGVPAARHGERGGQSIAIDRHRECAAQLGRGEQPVRVRHLQPEQPGRGIEAQRARGNRRGERHRQVHERAPADHGRAPGEEARDAERRTFAAQPDRARAAFGRGERIGIARLHRCEQHPAVTPLRNRERAAAARRADDRERRMGEELEEVWARGAEPELDHLWCHRDDLRHRAEHRRERIAAAARGGGTQPSRGRARIDPRAVGEAECVVQAVVRNIPADRQPRLDLACGIEADEALRGRPQQRGGRCINGGTVGIEQARRGTDDADVERRAVVRRPCAARGQQRGQHQRRGRSQRARVHRAAPSSTGATRE